MVPSNVQRLYEEHICVLTATERLRLVELITRGMAQPDPGIIAEGAAAVDAAVLHSPGGWQSIDRRGDQSEWRDRAL